jgi:hypothetical protein
MVSQEDEVAPERLKADLEQFRAHPLEIGLVIDADSQIE